MRTNTIALKERLKRLKSLSKQEIKQFTNLKVQSGVIPEHRLNNNNLSMQEQVEKFNSTFEQYQNKEYSIFE